MDIPSGVECCRIGIHAVLKGSVAVSRCLERISHDIHRLSIGAIEEWREWVFVAFAKSTLLCWVAVPSPCGSRMHLDVQSSVVIRAIGICDGLLSQHLVRVGVLGD